MSRFVRLKEFVEVAAKSRKASLRSTIFVALEVKKLTQAHLRSRWPDAAFSET